MMLVFDHVCVFYGDTPVLRELSFQVRSGEQVGLIGANGAGKSTLMKAALGLLPYTGSITVDGIPVTRKTLPEVRRKLGYVLQDADNQMFMPTVLDDMVFGPMNYGLSRAAAEQRAQQESELRSRVEERAGAASLGQFVRASYAERRERRRQSSRKE